MKYVKLINYTEIENIYKLWNYSYGNIYPISKELFKRNLSNASFEHSYVVLENEKLVGFIICKVWDEKFTIKDYSTCAWISLMMVDPKYRLNGTGSTLLNLVETEMRELGKDELFLGKDYLNYFPGLPVDLKSSAGWFEKRGFIRPYDTYDLIKKVSFNSNDKLQLKNDKFEFRVCNLEDKENLINFVKKNWPGRWEKETCDYFSNGGTGKEYVVALDDGLICAFAKIGYPNTTEATMSYSLTWRNRFSALGGIGPLGVDISYRKRNLGYDIVAFANNILIDNNVSEIIIDWTGLLDFYRRMNFEVFKSYFYMSKHLN